VTWQPARRIVWIAAVVTLVTLCWYRIATSPEPAWSLLALVVVVGGPVGWFWWRARRNDGVRRQAATARPGRRTHAVWAEEHLESALAQLGVESVRLVLVPARRPGGSLLAGYRDAGRRVARRAGRGAGGGAGRVTDAAGSAVRRIGPHRSRRGRARCRWPHAGRPACRSVTL